MLRRKRCLFLPVAFLDRYCARDGVDDAGELGERAVAKQLDLDYIEAKELRRRIMTGAHADNEPERPDGGGDNINWTIHDAVRGEAEALANEIALCLRYCLVTFRGLRPDRATVTGGQAYDAVLLDLLAKNLGVQCDVGRPLHDVDVSAANLGTDRRGLLSEWAACAGLAVRNIAPESPLPEIDDAQRLIEVTHDSLNEGVAQMVPGRRLSDIGHAVQQHVESSGFSVVREFVGHGIGSQLHEDPQVPNFGQPGRRERLVPGMVLAIEPMVNAGAADVLLSADDGWTARTRDGSLSAHFEVSVAIMENGPRVLGFPTTEAS